MENFYFTKEVGILDKKAWPHCWCFLMTQTTFILLLQSKLAIDLHFIKLFLLFTTLYGPWTHLLNLWSTTWHPSLVLSGNTTVKLKYKQKLFGNNTMKGKQWPLHLVRWFLNYPQWLAFIVNVCAFLSDYCLIWCFTCWYFFTNSKNFIFFSMVYNIRSEWSISMHLCQWYMKLKFGQQLAAADCNHYSWG